MKCHKVFCVGEINGSVSGWDSVYVLLLESVSLGFGCFFFFVLDITCFPFKGLHGILVQAKDDTSHKIFRCKYPDDISQACAKITIYMSKLN